MTIVSAAGPIHQRDNFLQENTPRSRVTGIARMSTKNRNPKRSGIRIFDASFPTKTVRKLATPQAAIKRQARRMQIYVGRFNRLKKGAIIC
jgi:hypothetical protein